MKNINNNILIKSLNTFNQVDYLSKCDLIYKYQINNIYNIPSYFSVLVKHENALSSVDTPINKFYTIVFFYFIFNCLPVVIYKNDIKNNTVSCLNIKLSNAQKIKIFFEYLVYENINIIQKKVEKSFLNLSINTKCKENVKVNFRLTLSTQQLFIHKELNFMFNDLDNDFERIIIQLEFIIKNTLYKQLVGSSKEDFLKNFMYFWYL